jgi:hypothetical protein
LQPAAIGKLLGDGRSLSEIGGSCSAVIGGRDFPPMTHP